MFRNVPKGRAPNLRAFSGQGLDFGGEKMVTVPETFSRHLVQAAPWARKDSRMRRTPRSTRWVAIAAVAGCAALATVLTATTPAAVDRAAVSEAHSCLVLAGSGDPTFTKNFNPY